MSSEENSNYNESLDRFYLPDINKSSRLISHRSKNDSLSDIVRTQQTTQRSNDKTLEEKPETQKVANGKQSIIVQIPNKSQIANILKPNMDKVKNQKQKKKQKLVFIQTFQDQNPQISFQESASISENSSDECSSDQETSRIPCINNSYKNSSETVTSFRINKDQTNEAPTKDQVEDKSFIQQESDKQKQNDQEELQQEAKQVNTLSRTIKSILKPSSQSTEDPQQIQPEKKNQSIKDNAQNSETSEEDESEEEGNDPVSNVGDFVKFQNAKLLDDIVQQQGKNLALLDQELISKQYKRFQQTSLEKEIYQLNDQQRLEKAAWHIKDSIYCRKSRFDLKDGIKLKIYFFQTHPR